MMDRSESSENGIDMNGWSIICCSVDARAAEALRLNVEQTIGMPFEFIPFDNTAAHFGLAKVYNLCAERARYGNLCFVHEDASFLTDGWGTAIAPQLGKKGTGVIGFAGGTMRLKGQHTMFVSAGDRRTHFCRGGSPKIHSLNPEGLDFAPVVTLDGMCLLVSKEVWRTVRFDEANLPKFHGYDMDFTIATTVVGYRNYVCNTALVEHRSDGSFTPEWVATMKLLADKWADSLPLTVVPMESKRLRKTEVKARATFLRVLMSKGLFCSFTFGDILHLIASHPDCWHAWRLTTDYLKYRLRYKHQKPNTCKN